VFVSNTLVDDTDAVLTTTPKTCCSRQRLRAFASASQGVSRLFGLIDGPVQGGGPANPALPFCFSVDAAARLGIVRFPSRLDAQSVS
jgi:hypothetical protein